MIEPDVIVDILKRVRDKHDLPDDVAVSVEADARLYWGGERCYIAKAGESPRRRYAHERAERIRADRRRGERVELLARRYELSERHIRRILGILEGLDEPPANDPASDTTEETPRRGRRRRLPDIRLP